MFVFFVLINDNTFELTLFTNVNVLEFRGFANNLNFKFKFYFRKCFNDLNLIVFSSDNKKI